MESTHASSYERPVGFAIIGRGSNRFALAY
jgi:hypothetical protein